MRSRALLGAEGGATSTPNEDHTMPRARQRSARQVGSYAEFPELELDSSNADSDNTFHAEVPERRKSLGLSRIAETSAMNDSTRLNKKALVVKSINDSQEIVDLSSLPPVLKQSKETNVSPNVSSSSAANTSLTSPGKYFSIAQMSETPTGQIKMKINRLKKPQRDGCASSSAPIVGFNRSTRQACQEIGMSPNKLYNIMSAATPPRRKEKENLTNTEQKRQDNNIIKTPRIRIKRVSSVNRDQDEILGTIGQTRRRLSITIMIRNRNERTPSRESANYKDSNTTLHKSSISGNTSNTSAVKYIR